MNFKISDATPFGNGGRGGRSAVSLELCFFSTLSNIQLRNFTASEKRSYCILLSLKNPFLGLPDV